MAAPTVAGEVKPVTCGSSYSCDAASGSGPYGFNARSNSSKMRRYWSYQLSGCT